MPISSRILIAASMCAALPTHAQSTTQKAAPKTTPKTAPKPMRPAPPQSEVSPLPAPDVAFTSPVIMPARSTTQTAPQTSLGSGEVVGDLAQFLSGKLVPLDIKLSDMKTGWQSLRVLRADAKSEEKTPRSHHDDFWNQIEDRFGSTDNRYFTQGRTLRFNNDVHLIVYSSQLPTSIEAGKWMEARFDRKQEPQLADILRLTREFLDTVPVRASLLNTRNVTSMEDIAAFSFETQFRVVADTFSAEYNAAEERRQKQIAATKSDPAIESNLKQLFEGVNQYTQDYDEKLPPLQSWAAMRKAIEPYVRNKSVWMDDLKITLHANTLLSGKALAHLKPYASSMVLFYSDADAKGERWVLRLDGQVRRVNSAQWPQLKKASRIP